jgi:hypothetical protein
MWPHKFRNKFLGRVSGQQEWVYNQKVDSVRGSAFCKQCGGSGTAGKWCLVCCALDGMKVERCFICHDDGPVWENCFKCVSGQYRPECCGICVNCGDVGPPDGRKCVMCRDGLYWAVCERCGTQRSESDRCVKCSPTPSEEVDGKDYDVKKEALTSPVGEQPEIIVIDSSSDENPDPTVSSILSRGPTVPTVPLVAARFPITQSINEQPMPDLKRLKSEASCDIVLRTPPIYELDKSGNIEYEEITTPGWYLKVPVLSKTEAQKINLEERKKADRLKRERGMGPVTWRLTQGHSTLEEELDRAQRMLIQQQARDVAHTPIKGEGDELVASMPEKVKPNPDQQPRIDAACARIKGDGDAAPSPPIPVKIEPKSEDDMSGSRQHSISKAKLEDIDL